MMRDRLSSELKTAMKAGEKRRVETIRLINAALKDRDIEARSSGQTIGEAEILSLLQKMIKSRQESEDIYAKAGRDDLAVRESEEIAIISEFLPRQMDEAAVEEAIDAAVASVGATSIKDMGKVVGALKADYAGRMDFTKASTLVKARLATSK